MTTEPVALVHDYLTQHGGAERVVLAMAEAFPGARLHTSLFDRDGTFPEFATLDVRTQAINRFGLLRRHHRLAFPLLAMSFSTTTVDAEVALCSSSGWAHSARVTGQKIVYCHTPARWLYQGDRYLGEEPVPGASAALAALGPVLRRWDRRAAGTAQRYLVNSSEVQSRVRDTYGLEADVVPPPPALGPDHPQQPVEGLEPGFWLCVSRLLPYKNVGAVVEAFAVLPSERLVVVGTGPLEASLRAGAGPNVNLVGRLTDDQLSWCYAQCRGVVATSHEDYGLTPLEGASFGRPAAVLRWGGFLDTVVEDRTGVLFDRPTPGEVAGAVRRAAAAKWSPDDIRSHAQGFSRARFVARLRQIVAEVRRGA